ncbi:hypothetical protein RhiJN_14679 [Ceratobasidium sp. AG-Ba]|nr:hypothetical protein RhiJN_14679 [Ceratobasidium sp. AG-Ba]QRW15216.1 hypothetical protein RhiLY_14215 [Ceratobasidium sp. AG-Ba]
MASHDIPTPSALLPPPTPPQRPTRPRLSRGISSRRPQPPPIPPSLRDHPLLDVVANGSSSSASASSSSTSSSTNNTPTAASHSKRPHSRRSSLSTSPLSIPVDKMSVPLPSPTGLWTLPTRPSPPIAGPWSAPIGIDPELVGDAMGLMDTVPAGSTISAASPNGYPWHAQVQRRTQGYDCMSVPHHTPGYTLYPPAAASRRPGPYPHPHSQTLPHGHAHQVPTSPSRQRHNHPVGTLHTHSPQPSPPVTPAAA